MTQGRPEWWGESGGAALLRSEPATSTAQRGIDASHPHVPALPERSAALHHKTQITHLEVEYGGQADEPRKEREERNAVLQPVRRSQVQSDMGQ